MADNYLEKTMEDLANGRFINTGYSKRKHLYTRHVYVRDVEAYGIEKVRELVREGAKVSFSFPDGLVGSKLARTLKCFYRPLSMGVPEDADICL